MTNRETSTLTRAEVEAMLRSAEGPEARFVWPNFFTMLNLLRSWLDIETRLKQWEGGKTCVNCGKPFIVPHHQAHDETTEGLVHRYNCKWLEPTEKEGAYRYKKGVK